MFKIFTVLTEFKYKKSEDKISEKQKQILQTNFE